MYVHILSTPGRLYVETWNLDKPDPPTHPEVLERQKNASHDDVELTKPKKRHMEKKNVNRHQSPKHAKHERINQ